MRHGPSYRCSSSHSFPSLCIANVDDCQRLTEKCSRWAWSFRSWHSHVLPLDSMKAKIHLDYSMDFGTHLKVNTHTHAHTHTHFSSPSLMLLCVCVCVCVMAGIGSYYMFHTLPHTVAWGEKCEKHNPTHIMELLRRAPSNTRPLKQIT